MKTYPKMDRIKKRLKNGPIRAYLWNSLYKERVPVEITEVTQVSTGSEPIAWYRNHICLKGWVFLDEVIWSAK